MSRTKSKSNRTKLIALIHAQKNAARLDDDTYRTLVFGATGKDTCTDCTMQELRTVFDDLNIVLEKQKKKTFRFFPRRESPTLLDAVTARAKKLLGEDWKARLDSFAASKLGASGYEQCDGDGLRRIMAFLTNVERRGK